VDVTCDPGETCVGGACAPDDPCADITCGAGEIYEEGNCVPDLNAPDPVAGETFFITNGCAICHGPDATGGFGPSLVDVEAARIFEHISGAETHTGGTVDGATLEDAEDIEAWIASLQ